MTTETWQEWRDSNPRPAVLETARQPDATTSPLTSGLTPASAATPPVAGSSAPAGAGKAHQPVSPAASTATNASPEGGAFTPEEDTRLQELEATIEAGVRTFVDVGLALLEIRDGRLYRAAHPTFDAYCRERWAFSRVRAHQLIEGAEVAGLLTTVNTTPPSSERQARELVPLAHEDEQAAIEVWQELREAHGDKVTATLVREAVANRLSVKPHVAQATGVSEWYTPREYVEAARRALGSIDLDPASIEQANEVVQADRFYTIREDGLRQEWAGRVFMNPPYSKGLIDGFMEKMAHEYLSGDVEEAIILVNNATETNWFQTVLAHVAAVCFPRGRVRFWGPEGETGAPLQGQAVLYLGPDVEEFVAAFGDIGLILYGRSG